MPDMSQMFGGGLKGKIGEFAMKQSMKRMANKMKKSEEETQVRQREGRRAFLLERRKGLF